MPVRHAENDKTRAFTHGAGAAAADMASGGALEEHRHIEGPVTRKVEPTPEGEKHDHMAEKEAAAQDRQEALIDEALEETFPGSDPISPKHIT